MQPQRETERDRNRRRKKQLVHDHIVINIHVYIERRENTYVHWLELRNIQNKIKSTREQFKTEPGSRRKTLQFYWHLLAITQVNQFIGSMQHVWFKSGSNTVKEKNWKKKLEPTKISSQTTKWVDIIRKYQQTSRTAGKYQQVYSITNVLIIYFNAHKCGIS